MPNTFTRAVAPLVALTAIAVASPAAVSAQQPAPPQEVQPIEDLADDELETFALVYIEVQAISQEVEAELATVQDPQVAQAIQQNTQERMEGVLAEHELEIERYRRIGVTLNQDPEMAERFVAIVEELQSDGGL